jgi:hypothetical protein
MKTMKNVMTVILVALGIQMVSASDIKIRTNGNKAILIEVTNGSVNENIKIFDAKGNLLFFENITKENYLKTFMMNNLPSGQYFIEYENDNKVNRALVEKNNDGELITSNFLKTSFKPMVQQNGDYLSIGFTNPSYNNVKISIEDLEGFEVVEVENLSSLVIRKNFNTKRLPQGQYIINVVSGKESFTKTIEIQ